MNLQSTFNLLKKKYFLLLTNPSKFFESTKKEHSYHQSLFFLVSLTLIATLINIFLTSPLLILNLASFVNVTWGAQLLTLVYYPLYSIIYVLMASLIIFLILLIFQTTNHHFYNDFKILAYIQTIPLIYGFLATIIVLVTELFTKESINTALLSVLTTGFPSVSLLLAMAVMFSLILTILSWIHIMWAINHALCVNYNFSTFKSISISLVALITSFILITLGSGLISF